MAVVDAEKQRAAEPKQQYDKHAATVVATQQTDVPPTGGSGQGRRQSSTAVRKVPGCANLLTPYDNGSRSWYCDHKQAGCDRQINVKPDGTYLGTRWSDRSRGGTYDMCDGCVQQVVAREHTGGSAGGGTDHTVKCPQGHELKSLGLSKNNGWACDGRHRPGGCKRGCTDFDQSDGWGRFRCRACDYDLCDKCAQL